MIKGFVYTDIKVRYQPKNVFNDVDSYTERGCKYAHAQVCLCGLCLASSLLTMPPMGTTVLGTPTKIKGKSLTKECATARKDQTALNA